MAALVVSHWLLDFIVHRPDLPLWPAGGPRVGLNAWSSLSVTLACELALFAAGVALYLRHTRAVDAVGRWALWGLLACLLLVYAGNLFGEVPPDVVTLAWAGQAQWLLVLWGWWVDRHRACVEPARSASAPGDP